MTGNIIIRPIITEKSMKDVNNSKFTFEVLKSADKGQIKREIEQKFGINVINISTMVVKGGTNRVGARRVEVKKSPWKKAIVTLKKDQKIDLFDIGA